MEKLIEVKNIAFRYNANSPYLFKNLSFDMCKGEMLCVVGKSGIGKSTLLRLLAKTLLPTSGNIEHYSLTKSSGFYSGFVFQDPRLLPWRNVYDNIQLPLECTNLSKMEKRERIAQAILQTKLTNLQDRYPHQLSGGQQQRVSLARALVTHAPLLLLDEPFSALDLESKEEMIEILKPLIAEKSLGIILVTHDMSDKEKLGAKSLNLRCNF